MRISYDGFLPIFLPRIDVSNEFPPRCTKKKKEKEKGCSEGVKLRNFQGER